LIFGFDLTICRPFLGGWTLSRPSLWGVTNFLKNITSSSSSSRFDRLKVLVENSGGDDVREPSEEVAPFNHQLEEVHPWQLGSY